MPTKRIVCLANSRKESGRCVAGKEMVAGSPGKWIRPVSNRPHGEVSWEERRYEDGSDPDVLDVIDIPLKEARPHTYQSENWILDPGFYWERVDRLAWKDLPGFADDPSALWLIEPGTSLAKNDHVPLVHVGQFRESIYLLHVEKVEISVFAPGQAFGNSKRRVQSAFSHRGVRYVLWVTDPVIERQFLAGKDGKFALGECYVTVSLGEPYSGFCYKLVAAIITGDGK